MQDTYSPIAGHWGVEGVWDAVFVGLAIAGMALLVLVLASRWREGGREQGLFIANLMRRGGAQ